MPLIYYITVFVQYNEIISDKNDFFEEGIKRGCLKNMMSLPYLLRQSINAYKAYI